MFPLAIMRIHMILLDGQPCKPLVANLTLPLSLGHLPTLRLLEVEASRLVRLFGVVETDVLVLVLVGGEAERYGRAAWHWTLEGAVMTIRVVLERRLAREAFVEIVALDALTLVVVVSVIPVEFVVESLVFLPVASLCKFLDLGSDRL